MLPTAGDRGHPEENDRVWKISSEKVPHLTLLFLGDQANVSNLDKIVQFVEHAATTSLRRFWLPVDRRGELGNDPETGPADVLFFRTRGYDLKAVADFRAQLLQDNNIKSAYDAAPQFEGPWVPHLTLGYQGTPAKPDNSDYPGFYEVSFDRIAVWTGNSEGPEFLLQDRWDDIESARPRSTQRAARTTRPTRTLSKWLGLRPSSRRAVLRLCPTRSSVTLLLGFSSSSRSRCSRAIAASSGSIVSFGRRARTSLGRASGPASGRASSAPESLR
jgi:2'-5' RNA ligase